MKKNIRKLFLLVAVIIMPVVMAGALFENTFNLSFLSLRVSAASEESPFSYELTNEADARYVPTYVKTSSGVETLFNPYSAEFALDLSVDSYDVGSNEGWHDTLSKHGYSQYKYIENGISFTVGNKKDSEGNVFSVFSGLNGTMAIKEMQYNGKKVYSIAVTFRGTNFKDIADVITDASIIPDEDGIHSGFSGAAKSFYDICKQVSFEIEGKNITVSEIIDDMKNPDSKYRMFVSGHSLEVMFLLTNMGYIPVMLLLIPLQLRDRLNPHMTMKVIISITLLTLMIWFLQYLLPGKKESVKTFISLPMMNSVRQITAHITLRAKIRYGGQLMHL